MKLASARGLEGALPPSGGKEGLVYCLVGPIYADDEVAPPVASRLASNPGRAMLGFVADLGAPMGIEDFVRVVTGDRPPGFPFEREIRLYQVQTWIYASDRPAYWIRAAGRLAAARFLERMEEIELGTRRGSGQRLRRLLRNEGYRALYDGVIGAYGGWTELLRTKQHRELDAYVWKRYKTSGIIADLIEHAFRYLDDGGTEKRQAAISHSVAVRAASGIRPSRTERSIFSHWTANKAAAVMIYVDQRQDFRLYPRDVSGTSFVDGLCREVKDQDHIHRFFGMCAYVGETLNLAESEYSIISIPSTIARLRPPTNAI
jgi:hypothetical protein